MKRFLSFLLLCIGLTISTSAQSTQVSPMATVSVLTCGPGSELFSSFGHSAFRVKDPMLNLDKVYNYGTFDFNAPNFYLNFAKGKLTYMLSTTKFVYFMHSYRLENRWVKEQELNLNPDQVQAVFAFLENNAKPANRSYQYDFFYDNCATIIEDVIKEVLGENVYFSNDHISTNKSHRDLIADYTHDFKWGKFGIDLALGSVIDDEATKDDYKFLPDYIFQAFDNAELINEDGTQPLVKRTVDLYVSQDSDAVQFDLFGNTVLLFSLIGLFIFYRTYTDSKRGKRSRWLDTSLFFITGIIGIVVLLLWFATDHTATYKNLNFLWAFAPNLVVGFYLIKSNPPNWVKKYLWLLIILLGMMAVLWTAQVQVFNLALIPLLVALLIRYFYLVRLAH